jgi:hypothetical protein
MGEPDRIPIAVRDLFTEIAAQPCTDLLRSVGVAATDVYDRRIV